MPLVSEIGDSVGTQENATFEWEIKGFLQLSEKTDDFYHSPVFCFADSFWYLILYPNGQSRNRSVGWIDLYLAREDGGAAKTVSVMLGIKNSGVMELRMEHKFSDRQREFGELKYLSREELFRKFEGNAMTWNVLTVQCKLKSHDTNVARTSVLSRLRNVGRNLQSVLTDEISSDFTLNCKGRGWPVHRAVLGSRSSYFQAMFRDTWAESTSGAPKLTEVDEDVLDSVLHFIYSGGLEDVSDDNVCSLYHCASALALEDLKAVCVEYLKQNMGSDLVLRAIQLAHCYVEEELMDQAVMYLVGESEQVFEKEEWREFKVKNPALAMKVLEKTVVKEGEVNKRMKLTASAPPTLQSQVVFPFG